MDDRSAKHSDAVLKGTASPPCAGYEIDCDHGQLA
jgi:hypothetical protein